MVSCLEIKIQGVFLQKKFRGSKSIHCEESENKHNVSVTWPFENM